MQHVEHSMTPSPLAAATFNVMSQLCGAVFLFLLLKADGGWQVVGLLARRVVTRVRAGETLATGARIGLMKFGSRMDVFVPPSATLTCAKGDKVIAGESIIARLAAPA